MKKKVLCTLLAGVMLLGPSGVYADEMYTVTQKPITVTYNGEDIDFPDAMPLIHSDRTLVPVRAIMERAQMTVDFDADTRTVKAKKEDLSIAMTIDDANATVTKGDASKKVTLDEPACIIDNRTYVPLRFIAESLGTKVNWNAAGREVVIIDTTEWADKIKAESALMDTLMHLSFKEREATAGTVNGEFAFNYALTNVKDEQGKSIDTNFDVKLAFTGTDVFDGTNSGSYISLDTDLSFLKELYAQSGEEYDEALLNKFAKPYTIDLDLIVDADWNIYAKSKALVSILKDADQTGAAEMIGDNYIKLSLADLLSAVLPVDADALMIAMKDADTLWEVLENLVATDDMLYSQSAAQLDTMINTYAALYNDKLFTVTKQRDGSELWAYKLDSETYKAAVLDMTKAMYEEMGIVMDEEMLAAQEKALAATNMEMSMNLTVKNGIPVKAEFTYNMDMNMPVDENGGTLSFTMKTSVGASDRAFNAKKDKKVVVPTQTVDLADVLGMNPLVILPNE